MLNVFIVGINVKCGDESRTVGGSRWMEEARPCERAVCPKISLQKSTYIVL